MSVLSKHCPIVEREKEKKEKTYRCVGVQMTTHVLDLQFQLVLRPSFRPLPNHPSKCEQQNYLPSKKIIPQAQLCPTLKARCSKKCAVPFVASVSALLPASIKTPTVAVCTYGECSVAIYTPHHHHQSAHPSSLSPAPSNMAKYTHSQSIGQGCRLRDDAGR